MSNITITELIEKIKITKISEAIKAIEAIMKPCVCKSCKTDITLETAISCDLCDEDEISPLFCKECTLWCDACDLQGCKECIKKKVCWECDYNMCYECLNTDNIMCGCFGECYRCGKDLDRGSDGWTCIGCEKWYCRRCRRCDNPCKDCCSEEESE